MTTVTTTATYKTKITADLPDWPSSDVTFQLVADFFTGSGEEVLAGKTYTMTLDATGNDDGAFYLPTPDNTGDTAVNWRLTLPSGYLTTVTVAYSASAQSVRDLIAAGATTTDPDTITAALASKANLVSGATADNLASLTSGGDLADSGYGVLDEDDMASDSDTAVPTQQSVKAYVDALTTADLDAVPEDAAILSKSGAYTLAAGDEAKIIECTGTLEIILPNGLDTGFQVVIARTGAGAVTISASTTLYKLTAGTGLESTASVVVNTAVTVYHRGSNQWVVIGDYA